MISLPIRRHCTALAALALLLSAAAAADPPSRVARLALIDGAVSFSPAGDTEWVRANPNRPLVPGDHLWADADARAEVQLAGATLWLGATTNVALVNLDDRIQQFQLTQGTLQLRVRGLRNGEQIEIDTPNFAFVATRPGIYRFDADADGASTRLYVRGGEGDVYGDGAAYHLASGQAVRFRGTDLADSDALGLAPPDPFERWAETRDARYGTLAASRYVAPEVIGYEDLDAYGTWRTVANVGNVWTPRSVPAGWAPYRNGHWTWIDPWGWTWVDDAPWGFAPFHYGRWTLIEDRWGWVPGPVRQRPVYAPALVAFIGGANFSLQVASGPAIGWFPLGPGEVYRPGYSVSRDYFTRVNVTNTVINTTYVTNVYNNRDRVTDVRYANFARPAAITAVAPAVFAQAQPVQRAAVAVDRRMLDKAEFMPLAKVTPQRESVTGAAPAARAAPTAQQKPAVAKAPPPPPPVPLATQLPALRASPGKPLERPASDTARPASPQPAPAQVAPAQTAPAQAAPAQGAARPAVRVVNAGEPKPFPTRAPTEAPRGRDGGKDKGPSPADNAQRNPAPPGAAPPGAAPAGATAGAPMATPQKEGPPKGPPPQAEPRNEGKGTPPQAETRDNTKASPAPSEPRDNVPGPQRTEPPRAKGPPPRDERASPPPPQGNAPAVAPAPASGIPPPRDRMTAPPAPSAQRAPESRSDGNGPPPRASDAPPRANAAPPRPSDAPAKAPPSPSPSESAPKPPPSAAPVAPPTPPPPPQGAPKPPPSAAPVPPPTPPPPPQSAPKPPPSAAPVPPPTPPPPPQGVPKPPPSAAPATPPAPPPPPPSQAAPKAPPPPAQDNEARGKGKGKDKGRNEDDDKK